MSASKTRRPAVGAAGQKQPINASRLFLITENASPRQMWRPIAPPKKRLPMSAELEAILHGMAKGGAQ